MVNDIPAGSRIDGELITANAAADINRARQFVRQMALRRGHPVFSSVREACEFIVERLTERKGNSPGATVPLQDAGLIFLLVCACAVDGAKLQSILESAQFDADCRAEFALFDRTGHGLLPREALAQILKHLHAQIAHLFPSGLAKPTVKDIVKGGLQRSPLMLVLLIFVLFSVVNDFDEDNGGALTYPEFKRFCGKHRYSQS